MRAVIGLEVHIELATKTKMFCGCSGNHFAQKPNTQVCPICLGLPGALPYANRSAIEATIALGLVFNCRINSFSKFDRKHYFYPDLPKAYQISQYDTPLCVEGFWESAEGKKVTIRRIHLEEDTGKLIHTEVAGRKVSLIDFNRSGVALVELVTEPDFETTNDISTFLKEVQNIVRTLGISSADMEKGSMRLEANVSVRKPGEPLPDYKVELKNINSFRFLEKAIKSEVERQRYTFSKGLTPTQETRGFSEESNSTFSQRTKEEAKDYRYFPEPDLPPLVFSQEAINKIRSTLPELPQKRVKRFAKNYNLPRSYISLLTSSTSRADYFETAVALGSRQGLSTKVIADIIVNKSLDAQFPEPAGLIKRIIELTKRQFAPSSEVAQAVETTLKQEVKAVADYHMGKNQVIGYLVGRVQKKLEGSGEPSLINRLLIEKLQEK